MGMNWPRSSAPPATSQRGMRGDEAQGQLQQQGIMIQQLQAELQLPVEEAGARRRGQYKMVTERLRAQTVSQSKR